MDTKAPTLTDPYNSAVAEVLYLRKAEIRMTFPTLEAKTGIGGQTLKRLLNNHTSIHMGNFLALCTALGLDPAEVVEEAMSKLAKASE